MRIRLGVTVLWLVAFAAPSATALVPAGAAASPQHNHGLTVNATPNPILAGEAVLIYGQLKTKPAAGRVVTLHRHVAGTPGYTLIGTTTTNAFGFYEFTRAEGVVTTNRSWYVSEVGAKAVHSRTVNERVAALVTLAGSTGVGDTAHPVAFSGRVTPNDPGERVGLQEQIGLGGNSWTTLASGTVGPGGRFAISHRFLVPGDHTLRVRLPPSSRNTAGLSDTTTVAIQQTEAPSFTIGTSAPIVDSGSSATISGILDGPGTTTPMGGVSVTLLGRQAPFTTANAFAPIGLPATTGADGSYSFAVTPVHNTEYEVETTFAPPAHRDTSVLFEGVRDAVTISSTSSTSTVGGSVTFSGAVSPDKAGHAIELQRLGTDGSYHAVEDGFVTAVSTYGLRWTFGNVGTRTFRVHIAGGPDNVSASSPPVSVTVASLPPVSSLPPAS